MVVGGRVVAICFLLATSSLLAPLALAEETGDEEDPDARDDQCQIDLRDLNSGHAAVRLACLGQGSCAASYGPDEVRASTGCVCRESCTIEAMGDPVVIRPEHALPDTIEPPE